MLNPSKPNAAATAALLELDGVCKRFGFVTVADSISFSLERRTCLGLVGPNGAGKTTLFNMIVGSISPDAGRIRFNGQDITHTPTYLRARLGIVRAFQIPQPFPHLTVYENSATATTNVSSGRTPTEIPKISIPARPRSPDVKIRGSTPKSSTIRFLAANE